MMTGRSILAGIDLGPATGKIVSYAASFSAAARAPVRLLYVMDFLLTPPSYLLPYIEEETRREEAEMARWQTVLQNNGVESDYRLMMGRLHESFVAAITEYRPDLLIIGYASHAFRPSSSERLIRYLESPMLVVRGKRSEAADGAPAAIQKILCAVDFSENSRKALAQASAYASAFSATLHVIHAVPSHTLKERWSRLHMSSGKEMDQFDASADAEGREALSRIIRDVGIASVQSELRHGMPSDVICAAAESGAYDLVVLGARGLSYVKGMLIGSVTEAVLKASPCPVLIVH